MLPFGWLACNSKSEDPNAQLNTDVKLIDNYLTSHGITNNIWYDNSHGIRFVISNYGEGPPPHSGQKVKVTYTGALLDGTIFSSGELNQILDDIEPDGLMYTLGALLEGTTATIYLPSQYAFGKTGTTGVPPNTVVAYQVFLEKIERTTAQQDQFVKDTTAISNFIENSEIQNAIKHPSGIWYKVTQDPGASSDSPTPYNAVTFNYKLKLLSDTTSVVDQGTVTNTSIFGLIDGMKIGLPRMHVGSSARFYIPSGLGYGSTGKPPIPSNANLLFEITLTAISQ
jgi:FKBP-type peptidyl-prolyl cis-trans isomerase